MTDKQKIEVLRKEIESYRQKLNIADKENKRLSDKLEKTNDTSENREYFHDNAVKEYEKLKDEYNTCIVELYEYKKKYLDLLEEMAVLKRRYQKEFDSLMKIIGKKSK